jgi:hypothetical protein
MATKDPHSQLFPLPDYAGQAPDPRDLRIRRMFVELAQEGGMSEDDVFVSGDPHGELTLVYDKISGPRH